MVTAVDCLRVVIAEDNLLVRAGLTMLVNELDDVELSATTSTFDELVHAVEEHRPHVVVTDIRMPPTHTDEGIVAARLLRRTHPDVAVLVLSQFVDPGLATSLMEDGSERRGYLLKDRLSDPGELLRAVRTIATGGSYVDPAVVDALMRARSRPPGSPLQRLTDREREVLNEMASGADNRAIAEQLHVGERAVEKHINSIFSKLGLSETPKVHRRVSAVLLALRETP